MSTLASIAVAMVWPWSVCGGARCLKELGAAYLAISVAVTVTPSAKSRTHILYHLTYRGSLEYKRFAGAVLDFWATRVRDAELNVLDDAIPSFTLFFCLLCNSLGLRSFSLYIQYKVAPMGPYWGR